MTKRAQLADGTILEFPADTPDEVMDKVVRQHISGGAPEVPQAPQADPNQVLSDLYNSGADSQAIIAKASELGLRITDPTRIDAMREYEKSKPGYYKQNPPFVPPNGGPGNGMENAPQPGFGETMLNSAKNLGTNLAVGAAQTFDAIGGVANTVRNLPGDAAEMILSGGGALTRDQTNAGGEHFSKTVGDFLRTEKPRSMADRIAATNPDAAQAPTAFPAQLLGGMAVPVPVKGPKPGIAPSLQNGLAKREMNALAPKSAAPAQAQNALADPRAIVEAGRREGVRVMTSDVKPPRTFIGKSARALGERIPIIGTGSMRAGQQESRVKAVKNLMDEYGAVAPDEIAADLAATRSGAIKSLTKAKNSVIEALSQPVKPIQSAPKPTSAAAEVPELNHFTGSWVAIDRETGKAVREIFDRSIAEKVNGGKYQLLPANEYLGRLNQAIKEAGGVDPSPEALKAAFGTQAKASVASAPEVVAPAVGPNIVRTPLASKAIDEQIQRLRGINEEAFAPVINKLKNFEAQLESGLTLSQVEGNRRLLGDLFADPSLASIRGDGQKALSAIYGPLREDMGAFIKQAGGQGQYTKWKAANDRLAAMAGELDNTAFKSALNKTETTPEAAAKLLFSKTPSDVKRLYNNLSPQGRVKAQSAIIHEAFTKAGGAENLSPDKFKNAMAAMDNATGIFFAPADKARLDGLNRLLAATSRASEAGVMTNSGQQAVPFLVGGAATQAPVAVAGAALVARLYETAPVRDALLRIGRTKPGSPQEKVATAGAEKIIARYLAKSAPVAADRIERAATMSPAPRIAAEEQEK